MKRLKESGASCRKKRKVREKDNRRSQESLLQYLGNTEATLSHEHGLKNPNDICLNDRNTKTLVSQTSTSTAATTASTSGSTSATSSVTSAREMSTILMPTTTPSFTTSSSPTSTSTQPAETFTATTVTVSSSSYPVPTTLSPSTTSEVTRSALTSTSEMSTTLVASTSSPVTTSSSETTSSPASTGTTQTNITPVTTATSALTSIPSQTTTSSSSTTTSTPVPNIKLEEKEISNKDDFQRKVTKGSHIARKRTVCSKLTYKHHMLVIKVEENTVDVIEYTSPSLGKINVPLVEAAITKVFGKIKKTTIKIDDFFPNNSSEVFIVNCDQHQEMTAEQKDDAIKRAESRLGEQQYFLTCNNCENFVTWALLGKSICEQWRNAGVVWRLVLDWLDAVLSNIPKLVHLFLEKFPKVDKLIYGFVSVVKILSVYREGKDENENIVTRLKSMIFPLFEICTSPFLPDPLLEMLKIVMFGKKNFIANNDMWREIFKRLFSIIISVVAILFIQKFCKSKIALTFFHVLFRHVSSVAGGFLFDNVFEPIYRYLSARTNG